MQFLNGTELSGAIRETVEAGPVEMAVAFWGNAALERLGLPLDLSTYRVACDARSGACSPKALKGLLERGAAIVDVVGLHAKVYRTGGRMVVTSANASTNGLAEDTGASTGLEAGMLIFDRGAIDDAGRWFETLFDSGQPVERRHLPEIARLWARRRNDRPLRETLAQALLANAPSLRNRTVRVYVYASAELPEDVEKLARAELPREAWQWDGGYWPFFWDDMPGIEPGDELLCFAVDGANVTCEFLWQVFPPISRGKVRLWPAARIESGLGGRLGDMRPVSLLAAEAWRAGRLQIDQPPIALPTFAAALIASFRATHLALIRDGTARSAYSYLLDHLAAIGLVASPKSGRVPAVRLEDATGCYAFSFIVNRADLLFYLRDLALNASPGLARRAEAAGFIVEIPRTRKPGAKPKTERQIRIRTPDEARQLVAWLTTEMPLSGSPSF